MAQQKKSVSALPAYMEMRLLEFLAAWIKVKALWEITHNLWLKNQKFSLQQETTVLLLFRNALLKHDYL